MSTSSDDGSLALRLRQAIEVIQGGPQAELLFARQVVGMCGRACYREARMVEELAKKTAGSHPDAQAGLRAQADVLSGLSVAFQPQEDSQPITDAERVALRPVIAVLVKHLAALLEP